MNKFDFDIRPFDSDQKLRDNFKKINPEKIKKNYSTAKLGELEDAGFKKALKLFNEAAIRVPAYKDFLKQNNINPKKIRTKTDFDQIPITNKENYLKKYPLKDLVWDSSLEKYYIMSSSSGSTGNPFFWPRGLYQEIEGAIQSELIYNNFFNLKDKKTLYVIGFAIGTWIAGPYMLAATELVSQKNGNIVVVTPGTDKELFISLVKNLAPNFERIILAGYPPIIKDIVDQAKDFDLDWKGLDVKTFFAGENFTEGYREHILRKIGSKGSFTDCISVYGSADAAILGHETPITTLIRKLATKDPIIAQALFHEPVIPSLVNYHPTLKYFQAVGEKIVFSTYSGIPLIRYAIGDRGGILNYEEMKNLLASQGIDLEKEIKENKLTHFNWKLPLVYLFGRTDLTAIFYGANIYPENIKPVLDNKKWSDLLSGKFLIYIDEDIRKNKKIRIKIEISKGSSINKDLLKVLENDVFGSLIKLNSEYSNTFKSIGDKAKPIVDIVEYGAFKINIKHKWAKNS